VVGGSDEAPGDPAAYELLFKEAVRGAEGQRQGLDELRSRAGILISTATLVAGFVGPTALAANAPAWIEVTAVGLLLLAVLTSLFILLPSSGWRFTVNAKDLLGQYVEADPPASMAELHRSLAWHLQTRWQENQARLVLLYRVFTASVLLVAAETVFWLLAIVLKGKQ
jgi:hypothetical protein